MNPRIRERWFNNGSTTGFQSQYGSGVASAPGQSYVAEEQMQRASRFPGGMPLFSPTPQVPNPATAPTAGGSPGVSGYRVAGSGYIAGLEQPDNQDFGPVKNTATRWQPPENEDPSASERFYTRKLARDSQASTRNPGIADFYRQQRRITPGSGNITGYGTPARPPQGMGMNKGSGYAQVTFNNSGWTPY